jgi:hypothetical protein
MSAVATHFDPKIHVPLGPTTVPLVLWDIIENTWAGKNVTFTRDYPTEPINGPTIVWKIYRRIPGRGGLETLAPRPRQFIKTAADQTSVIDQWAQWHTVIYQFDLFDVSSSKVDDLLEDFEMLMFYSTATLKDLGICGWFFDEQLIDTEVDLQNIQFLPRRTLRYRCILERKYLKQVPTIQQIWIHPVHNAVLIENELVTRGTDLHDLLAHNWLANIVRVTRDPRSTDAKDEFIVNVDFYPNLDLSTGASAIAWIKGAKHPKPGEKYYVTYYHNEEDQTIHVEQ